MGIKLHQIDYNTSLDTPINENWCTSGASEHGLFSWTPTSVGAGAGVGLFAPIDNKYMMVSRQITGTTATGRNTLILGGAINWLCFGDRNFILETIVKIPVLATVAQAFTTYIGFGDNSGAGDPVDGIYFFYSQVNANWIIKNRSNNVETQTITATVVNTNWVTLRIVISTTSSTFFINNVNVGNIATNFPTGIARATNPMLKIQSTNGTTSKELYNNAYYLTINGATVK